ncbi:protein mono-ADP-ribosyltransferase PARP12-like isoform X2 [Palaemon carinicauda]|uniref:protein mono-ADP-ribosyltransferase PARP12-like isoform X2 n=1 Tax=Palaemon carinicauda TaxID=392227 RepID=UPI0035B5A7D5
MSCVAVFCKTKNQSEMARWRVYRQEPELSSESSSEDDSNKGNVWKKWTMHPSEMMEDHDKNVSSFKNQPDHPGHIYRMRNIGKKRGRNYSDGPRNTGIRMRPARPLYDDQEEEDRSFSQRTPRNKQMERKAPDVGDNYCFDRNQRGGQKSPDINQGPRRRRNDYLQDRQFIFPSSKDSPRQRSMFTNEAPNRRRSMREKGSVRGPLSHIDLSLREDRVNQRSQGLDWCTDEDDEESDFEERRQNQEFSGGRIFPDNSSLRKEYWNDSRDLSSSSEDHSDDSENGRHAIRRRRELDFHHRDNVTSEKLINALCMKRDLQATLLYLHENYHMKTKLVRQVVKANPHILRLVGEVVEIKVDIKICNAHNGTVGCLNRTTCRDLHICSNYVKGKCDNSECVMGHNWHTRHNKGILRQLNIQDIPEGSLERLFLLSHSDKSTSKHKPSVCYKYNKGECRRQQCPHLHVCSTYITNNLKCTKQKCKLNHDLLTLDCCRVLETADIDVNETPRDILVALLEANPSLKIEKDPGMKKPAGEDQKIGITKQTDQGQGNAKLQDDSNKTEGEPKIKNIKQKIRTCWSTQAYGDVNVAEICYNSVEGLCSNETTGCQKLHALEHYHWQMSENGSNWLNLQTHQVKALESAFCDVNNDGVEMPRVDPSNHQGPASSLLKKIGREALTADFKTMKLVNSTNTISFQIRRLCTEVVPGKVIDAATHVWYFLDKQHNWVEYGKVDSLGETNLVVSLTSDDIEKQFRKDSSTAIQFQNSKFTYTLDLQLMIQTNLQTQVGREVRRRPQIHLQEEQAEQKLGKLPAPWDAMKVNERMKRVGMSSSSDEYKKILQLVGNISGNVTKIERVQHRFHWQAFQNKTEEMADIYGDPTKVDIRQLFHGTASDIVPKICNENFDPKLHGQSAGQAYGQGTYFARDASLSYGYCKSDSAGFKYLFVAKVAVGSLTTGNSSMVRPPINPSTGLPFDSTCDNATNPSIIVKYDKAEYFPEYILTLK